MSSKRWFVDKHDATQLGDRTTQVGAGSKTGKKALELKARMRAQQQSGSSDWYTVREGRKR